MGGDRIPGPLSRFIPSLDEFLRVRLKALAARGPVDPDKRERRRREAIRRTFGVEDEGLSPEELLERAQASWIAEFGELDSVALETLGAGRGNFLTRYSRAWLAADAWNKRLMRPVWESLINKYDLHGKQEGAGKTELGQNP